MNHRWIARLVVAALHLGLLAALWLHRPPKLADDGPRRVTTVRLIQPQPRVAPAPAPTPVPAPAMAPRPTAPAVIAPPPFAVETPATVPPTAAADPALPAPSDPPRTTLRLTLPPGYAASSAAARNPALSDPRSNTPRTTFEERIADATGGAGAWVEEKTSENRSQSVGALGDRRTVMRRGNTCVEIFRSRIADMDQFNGNVAPRAISMVGKPYKCK